MSCVAIIVAAGQGRRMGFDKLLAPLAGQSVLQRSLDAFLATPEIDAIVVVTDEQRFATLQWPDDRKVFRVDGGTERYDSVLAGLRGAPESATHAAVHDGARPLVHPAAISSCVATARETGAAALARRVTETLKRADAEDCTVESVPRDGLWVMETPQVFAIDLLRRAYGEVIARKLPVTDDVSAAEAIGHPTKLVEDPYPNPKITVPADLPTAEALLAVR